MSGSNDTNQSITELAELIAKLEVGQKLRSADEANPSALEHAANELVKGIRAVRLQLEPTPREMATALIEADKWLADTFPEYRARPAPRAAANRAAYTLGLWTPRAAALKGDA